MQVPLDYYCSRNLSFVKTTQQILLGILVIVSGTWSLQPWKRSWFYKPGALLGVVGGDGVLKGSKGTGSKSKEVVFGGFWVIEVVLLALLEL